jgi:hypothetical protein
MHDERGTQLKGLQLLTSELSKLEIEVQKKPAPVDILSK